MTPQILVVYTSTLFAQGLTHLLSDRTDCTISGVLPIALLTARRLAETPATLIILEGDEVDPAITAAIRLLQDRSTAFTLIRVNLSAPTLHVYRFDGPMPAGLDELTGVIRSLTDQPAPLTATMHSRRGYP